MSVQVHSHVGAAEAALLPDDPAMYGAHLGCDRHATPESSGGVRSVSALVPCVRHTKSAINVCGCAQFSTGEAKDCGMKVGNIDDSPSVQRTHIAMRLNI